MFGLRVEEIENLLYDVAKKEKLELFLEFATRVATVSGWNMWWVLLVLEMCRVNLYLFKFI